VSATASHGVGKSARQSGGFALDVMPLVLPTTHKHGEAVSTEIEKPVPLSDVAEKFGMTITGVRNWCKFGVKIGRTGGVVRLEGYKAGGRWFTPSWDCVRTFLDKTNAVVHSQQDWLTEQQQAAKALGGETRDGNSNRRRRVSRLRKSTVVASAAGVSEDGTP
jgi:hypothetical protein